jgi:hypothetical protein
MKIPAPKNRVFAVLCVVLTWATCLHRQTLATRQTPAKRGDEA